MTRAVPLTTGAGNVTSSERQLEYAKAWGTNGWYAQGDYLGRLTQVAKDMSFDLRQLPTKFLFTFLFIAWALIFGIGLQLVPHTGANSPYGGLGLVALFTGFFIMMGLIWAVIGE